VVHLGVSGFASSCRAWIIAQRSVADVSCVVNPCGGFPYLARAVIRAVRSCPTESRSMLEVAKLMVLYFVYGLARLASVINMVYRFVR
jgi:hypothetical protein